MGLALSGAAGARLAQRLGISISGETRLRLLKRNGQQHVATTSNPTIVGVDDRAFKRAHRYGTLLVDLEQRRPLDLLPDRDATSVANWLTGNRAIRIVSRDRAGVDAKGITRGAPQAIQVADRWHLLKHLGDAIERALSRCQRPIREVARSLDHEHASAALPAIESNAPGVAATSRARSNKRSGAKRGSHAMGRSCTTIKVGWQYARLRALRHWIGVRCGIGSTPVGLLIGRNGHPQPASWIPIERILPSAGVKAAKTRRGCIGKSSAKGSTVVAASYAKPFSVGDKLVQSRSSCVLLCHERCPPLAAWAAG
jgi:hypothetical protein